MMDFETPKEAAIAALNAGLSTIPPRMDGTKAPIGEWKQYQENTPSIEDIERWYSNGQTGVGLVTGAVSGNLECLDFDTHDIWEQYKESAQKCGLWDLVKRVAFGYSEETPNGFHLLYKCESIEGNTKLAKKPDDALPNKVKTLIETRGKGGFIIVAPSNGKANPDGDYVLKAGGFKSIVTISSDEREQLHTLAKSFDEIPLQDNGGFVGDTKRGSENINNRPGDEFIRTTTWEQILEPHGWTKAFVYGGTTSWRRPGKEIGISATTNHGDSDLLYVFSTSTIFDAERGYNKFSVYTLLNHGGNFKEAAKELRGIYQLSAPQNNSTPATTENMDWSPQALSELPEYDYAKVRNEAAKNNGVRPADLDKEVKRLRTGEESTTQGKAIELYEPEPWGEPVDGLVLMNSISEMIKRHMSLRDADADTSAIWAAHTYLYEAFSHTPRLCITAPDAECGKTVLMSHMIGNLVTRPQIVENMSPAPFFRLASSYQPTFLIDEVDAFLKEDSDLISALNNGWEPHGCVLRCAGDDHEVFQFSTHCPVAMAGIELYNRLPTATLSRSIVIHLERAIEDEVREEYDKRKHSHDIKVLGRKLARWCQDHYEELKNLDPLLPQGVKNRLADKWRPLMAIAQVAGGNWPSRIERAMFSQIDMSEPSKRHQLLTDMMEVMDGDLHTTTLIEKLCNMADSPWSGYNFKEHDKDRRHIKPRQLANLLKGYRVHPKDVRAGSSPRKGYYFTEVKQAYDRYIGVHPPEKCATTLQRSNDVGLQGNTNATECSGYNDDTLQTLHDVADRTGLKAKPSIDCSAVADISGGKALHEGTL